MLEGILPNVTSVPKLRRFLCVGATSLYILSLLLVPLATQAGQIGTGGPGGPRPGTGTPTPVSTPVPGTGGGGTSDPTDFAPGPTTDPSVAAAQADYVSQTQETPMVEVRHGSCTGSSINAVLHCFVVTVFGSLAGIGGKVLDYVIQEFIIGFGELYLTSNLGSTLEELWGTMRDLFNLTFIFGLVYIGFQIILGVNDTQAKRTIPYLILAALLINFSLFIVKFIIDFSNFAAAQLFNVFTSVRGPTVDGGVNIGTAFVTALDISTLFGAQGTDVPFLYTIGSLLIFLILFYVFISAAIMIIVRFIALCFYIVVSPVMFLGWVFPGFGGYTKDFWRGLLGQAFFAPALLFLFYVSFAIIYGFNDRISMTTINNGANAGTVPETVLAIESIVPFFMLTVGFLIASLVVARKIGFAGGGMAIAWAEKARGGMQTALQRSPNMGGLGGYLAYKGMDKAANSRIPGINNVGRALTMAGARDRAEKAYKGSALGSYNATQTQRAKDMKNRQNALASERADASSIKDIKKYARNGGAELENAVKGASTGQIISTLRDYNVNSAEYKNIVSALTHDQRKKIMDSKDDEFSVKEKSALAKSNDKSLRAKFTGTDGKIQAAELAKLTPKQADILGNKWINENLHLLTNSQVEKLATDSTVLAETEKSTLKAKWSAAIESKLGDPASPFDFAAYMSGRTAKDVAALPAKVLIAPGAAPYLTEKVLREVAIGNMIDTDREKIEQNMTAVQNADQSGLNYLTRPKNSHRDLNWR
jgi:hypothetical protein